MITLAIYIYFWSKGMNEWDSDIALGLAVFDLLFLGALTDATFLKMDTN